VIVGGLVRYFFSTIFFCSVIPVSLQIGHKKNLFVHTSFFFFWDAFMLGLMRFALMSRGLKEKPFTSHRFFD